MSNNESKAMEVWREAIDAASDSSIKFKTRADQAAARVIATALEARDAEIAALKGALTDAGAHLAAAISLLERGGKAAKKAAPSDRMFDQMLTDYHNSLERARAILTKEPSQ